MVGFDEILGLLEDGSGARQRLDDAQRGESRRDQSDRKDENEEAQALGARRGKRHVEQLGHPAPSVRPFRPFRETRSGTGMPHPSGKLTSLQFASD